jgi:hypothetical protein
MGLVMAFAMGYVVGARGGNEGLDEVIRSLRAIRDSPEMKDLVEAVRAHVGYTLRELASRMDDGSSLDLDLDDEGDLVDQVRRLTERD